MKLKMVTISRDGEEGKRSQFQFLRRNEWDSGSYYYRTFLFPYFAFFVYQADLSGGMDCPPVLWPARQVCIT